jgi:hypothetical protein
VSEKKKFDGSVNKLGEAVVGDSTGIVTLLVRNGMHFTIQSFPNPPNFIRSQYSKDLLLEFLPHFLIEIRFNPKICVLLIEALDTVKEGATISVMNALAKVQNKFLKVDIDKWARVVPSDHVIDSVNSDNDIS